MNQVRTMTCSSEACLFDARLATDLWLNTMLSASRLYTAEVIIHELAHQEIYIDDDTAYNEAFATAVADEGLRRWLESRDDNVLSQRARSVQVYRSAFIAPVDDYRERLISPESDSKDGIKLSARQSCTVH